MTVEITRASTMAIKEETTTGDLIAPSAGSDYIPLRAGAGITVSVDQLESDEFINNLGVTKAYAGKENVSGDHPAYVKHSGVEGQAPEVALLFESALGISETAAAEYNTVAASTTTVVKVDAGEGASYSVGECVLVKDALASSGYSMRNIVDITGDDLTLNFALNSAPGAGVELGKAILIKPATTGHPSYSVWKEDGDGGAVQAVAGCKTSNISYTLNAAGLAEVSFTYAGTKYFLNPIEVTSSNSAIDFTDGSGTVVATLTEGFYRTPIALAAEVALQMTTASAASEGATITCSYISHGTDAGKFIITSDGTVLSLLWLSGANNATGAYAALGFDKIDETGALTYTSDSEITHVIPGTLTPSYDASEKIVVKQAELMIGDATDNLCRKAGTLSFTVDATQVDADSICAQSGIYEKVPSTRSVTMSASIILEKHEVGLFDKFINNTSTQVMANIGIKTSNGNWIAGDCANIFMGNATISGYSHAGDDYITVELEAKGFVTDTMDDIYLNYI